MGNKVDPKDFTVPLTIWLGIANKIDTNPDNQIGNTCGTYTVLSMYLTPFLLYLATEMGI